MHFMINIIGGGGKAFKNIPYRYEILWEKLNALRIISVAYG